MKDMKKWIAGAAGLLGTLAVLLGTGFSLGAQPLMNQAKDMSAGYVDMSATYFFAERLASFDAAKGEGTVQWGRFSLEPRQAFNTNTVVMDRLPMKDFPERPKYLKMRSMTKAALAMYPMSSSMHRMRNRKNLGPSALYLARSMRA